MLLYLNTTFHNEVLGCIIKLTVKKNDFTGVVKWCTLQKHWINRHIYVTMAYYFVQSG